jgi:hypothetical protein
MRRCIIARYSDEFRASAVVMLEANGYPDKKGVMHHISKQLQVPRRTLRRWYHRSFEPPADNLVTQKKETLKELLEFELRGIFNELPDARQDADYRELATAAGIFIDKLTLLGGGPTSREERDVRITIERRDQLHDQIEHTTP